MLADAPPRRRRAAIGANEDQQNVQAGLALLTCVPDHVIDCAADAPLRNRPVTALGR